MSKKKHFIGFGIFLLLLVFFYTYSLVIFSFNNESSKLFECIFISVYICFLIALALYYVKNSLIAENIVLLIFALVFADPFILGLIYYPITIMFEGTAVMETLDRGLYIFTYPFDIFYSDIIYLTVFLPIIPLLSLIILLTKKKKAE